jgi:hypothetical protein
MNLTALNSFDQVNNYQQPKTTLVGTLESTAKLRYGVLRFNQPHALFHWSWTEHHKNNFKI